MYGQPLGDLYLLGVHIRPMLVVFLVGGALLQLTNEFLEHTLFEGVKEMELEVYFRPFEDFEYRRMVLLVAILGQGLYEKVVVFLLILALILVQEVSVCGFSFHHASMLA